MPQTTNRPLLARIAAPEALLAAWQRVAAKAAGGGSDRVSTEDFARRADAELAALRKELLEDRYTPQPLLQVKIPKAPGSAERRTLGLPAVRDKVVQEAARAVLEPTLDRLFFDCSYGYRRGRGPQRAIARVNHYLSNIGRRWVVLADIDDFFGSVPHAALIDRLRPILQDEAVLKIVELWLKMGTVDPGGRWRDIRSGIAQGAVISPLLANFYLHPFDQSMIGRGRGLVRYADDFVILCADRAEAEDALRQATDFLTGRLALKLNPNPRPIATLDDGFAFLGVWFHGERRLLDLGKFERIAAKITHITSPPHDGDFAPALRLLNEAVVGWRRFYGRIVAPAELDRIETLQTAGLAKLVAQAFRRGAFRAASDAELALANVELLHDRPRRERDQHIVSIAREGRTLATAQTLRPPAPRPGNGARIRSRKRRHYRNLARTTELVLNTPGCFVGKTHQRVVVRQNRQNICEVPVPGLTGVTVASHGISLSTDVVSHCAENDIPLVFVSPRGKVVAFLTAPDSPKGSVNLLQLQALSQGAPATELAKRFAEGKIRNQISLMKYCHKYRKHVDPDFAACFSQFLTVAPQWLAELRGIRYGESLEACRGHILSIEGRAASQYWNLAARLLRPRADFPGREGRGATDLVNSLLNYGYALLQARVHLAVLRAGLTPQISFLHALQKDKPTLVYDLMEEFRPQAVDRTVFAMLARGEPLELDEQGLLTDATRRRLITRVHERLATLLRFRGRELKLDEIIQEQAKLLISHLKGERGYRPFLAKW